MATDRYVDLLRQGFMRPVRTPRRPKVKRPVEIVACEACRDWHVKGKHTKPKAQRLRTGKQTVIRTVELPRQSNPKPVSVCQNCGVIIRKTANGWRHIKATGCTNPAPVSPRRTNPATKPVFRADVTFSNGEVLSRKRTATRYTHAWLVMGGGYTKPGRLPPAGFSTSAKSAESAARKYLKNASGPVQILLSNEVLLTPLRKTNPKGARGAPIWIQEKGSARLFRGELIKANKVHSKVLWIDHPRNGAGGTSAVRNDRITDRK